jgi:uncharacterized protein YhaN
MRIESIEISAFGHFNRVQLGPFSNRVAIIYEPGQPGPSVIHAFIQAILVGFPPTDVQAARQVTAFDRYGGRLIVRSGDKQRYTIERFREMRDGRASVIGPDGEVAGDEVLHDLLAHVSTDVYSSCFAFGAEGLLPIDALSGDVASTSEYASTLGIEQIPEILCQLEGQAKKMFDPGQADSVISQLVRNLDEIERALAVTRSETDSYHELRRRRDEVNLDIRQVEYEIAVISHVEQRIVDEEARTETRMSQLEQVSDRPEGAPQDEVQDQARLRREIDVLRENWTRLQAVRRMIDVYQQTIERQKIPRSPWFLALLVVGIILPVVIGAVTGQKVVLAFGIASAVPGMITLVLAAIARARFESAQLQALLHLELTHREAEGRFLHSAMAMQIDPAQISDEIDRLERIYAEMLETTRPEHPAKDRELLEEARRLAYSEAHAALEQRDAGLTAALAEDLGLPDTVAGSLSDARRAADRHRDALLIERAKIDEQLHILEHDRRSTELRSQREELLTSLDEQVSDWSTTIAAGILIDEAVQSHILSQQSHVLRFASDAFDSMTLGTYHQLIALDDGITAVGRDGRQTSITEMGRGTREQAYLALRIGIIRNAGRRGQRLPVLIDDILVNFDQERAVEALRALDTLTSDHQLFIFTSHSATIDMARSVIPGASVAALEEQKLSGLTPTWLNNA